MEQQQLTLDDRLGGKVPAQLLAPGLTEAITSTIAARLASNMVNPVAFVVPWLSSVPESMSMLKILKLALSEFSKRGVRVPLVEFSLSLNECVEEIEASANYGLNLHCFALDTKSMEAVKDRVKEALWPVWIDAAVAAQEVRIAINASAKPSVLADLVAILSSPVDSAGAKRPNRRMLSIADHGLFFPCPKAPTKDVRVVTYDHGGGHFYRYRVSDAKLEGLPNELAPLRSYLLSLPFDCPNHFFKIGPRMSAIDWMLKIECESVKGHPLSRMAQEALAEPKYKSGHDNVEVYCVENDPLSIAVEIPVWLEPGELNGFSSLFSESEPLTGHIDLLRFAEGKIEIWDYKPKAGKETAAALQVLLYAIALSIRTSLPLSLFRCGFFDGDDAFTFEPSKTRIVSSTIAESE